MAEEEKDIFNEPIPPDLAEDGPSGLDLPEEAASAEAVADRPLPKKVELDIDEMALEP